MGRIARAIRRIAENPRTIIASMAGHGLLNGLSDESVIKLLWWAKTGKSLDLSHPKGFNEKMQWLKLYDRRPEYTTMVDKYLVKSYVANIIGSKYVIPTIGAWDNPEDIDFDNLPNQFVLKCNHNSGGGMCICTDKTRLDIAAVKKGLRKALSQNYYYAGREWPYKNVKPKIIAEAFIVDNDKSNTTGTLVDYKFHCFNGEPKFLYVGTDDISSGTKGELRLSFFDMNWNTPPFYRTDHRPIPLDVPRPEGLDEMIMIARALSKNIPFVRVDLYWVNHQVLFSELTFFPGAGYGFFSPAEWEETLGCWIKLPPR